MGSRHPSIAPFEAFKTKDSYIIIAAGNDKLFEKLCNVLNLNEFPSNSKYNTNSSRAQNMDELKSIIEEKLSAKNTSLWVQEMENEKIPCGPIFNIKEAVEIIKLSILFNVKQNRLLLTCTLTFNKCIE